MKLATLSVLLVLVAGCGGDDEEEPAQQKQATTAVDEAPPPPKDRTKGLEKFIRLSYEIAIAEERDTSGQFTEEGKDLLREADTAWQEYADRVDRPKTAIARMMVQAYGPTGLDQPADAAEAAEIVAQADPSPQAYLELVQHAARAGQTRKADLAAKKAIELAPPASRAEVRGLAEQAKLTPPLEGSG